MTINQNCFEDCSGITNIKLPETLTDLRIKVFKGIAIKSLVIPATVSSLKNRAFMDSPNLIEV